MTTRAIRMFLFCVLLLGVAGALSSSAANGPPSSLPVHEGDTLEQIKAKLGEPKSSMKAGARMILNYPQGTVVMVDDKAVEISLPPPAPMLATRPKPAPAKTAPAPEAVHPADVRVVAQKDSNGITTLVAESDCDLDFTITLEAQLTNMTCSRVLPLTVDSRGKQSVILAELWPTDSTKASNYQANFRARYGGLGNVKSTDAIYELPFAGHDPHRIDQGNHGKFSHAEGSQNDYAVDFGCPEGTPIAAAREGVVVGIRQDYTLGGIDEKLKSQGNYVITRHPDGTYAEYFHLKHNCVQVRLGDKVATGQIIALSGATGYAAGPHLHFAIFVNTDGSHRITLPVHYRTPQGVLTDLKQGGSY